MRHQAGRVRRRRGPDGPRGRHRLALAPAVAAGAWVGKLIVDRLSVQVFVALVEISARHRRRAAARLLTREHREARRDDNVPVVKIHGRVPLRGGTVQVTLLYFDDCPNWQATYRQLETFADELGFDLERRQVTTPEDADRLTSRGSPTILVDGDDPFATGNEPVGLACRVYVTDAGLAGAPTEQQLREAVTTRDLTPQ